MRQKLKHILYFTLLATLISCGNNKSADEKQSTASESVTTETPIEKFSAYKILRTEPYESGSKAQVKCYAYLTTDTITKDRLSATLIKIYFGLRNYKNFKNFSAPTVIGIYLFTSEDKAANMTESWIAMLSKSPSDNQPTIRFDDMKLSALESGKGKEKSVDDLLYEKMNESFKKHNTDLCSIYRTLYDIEEKQSNKPMQNIPILVWSIQIIKANFTNKNRKNYLRSITSMIPSHHTSPFLE